MHVSRQRGSSSRIFSGGPTRATSSTIASGIAAAASSLRPLEVQLLDLGGDVLVAHPGEHLEVEVGAAGAHPAGVEGEHRADRVGAALEVVAGHDRRRSTSPRSARPSPGRRWRRSRAAGTPGRTRPPSARRTAAASRRRSRRPGRRSSGPRRRCGSGCRCAAGGPSTSAPCRGPSRRRAGGRRTRRGARPARRGRRRLRTMSTYSRVRASGFGYGWPYQPSTTCGPDAPRPRMTRPPERWSSVIAAIAVAVGVRADSWTMPVPRRMRSVWAPHQASGVRASEP